MTSDEGLDAYGAATWGQFFLYQGFNDRARLDAHARPARMRSTSTPRRWCGRAAGCSTATAGRSGRSRRRRIAVPYRTASGMASRTFTVYRTHHGPIVRAADGKWISVRLMEKPVEALSQSYLADQGAHARRISAR